MPLLMRADRYRGNIGYTILAWSTNLESSFHWSNNLISAIIRYFLLINTFPLDFWSGSLKHSLNVVSFLGSPRGCGLLRLANPGRHGGNGGKGLIQGPQAIVGLQLCYCHVLELNMIVQNGKEGHVAPQGDRRGREVGIVLVGLKFVIQGIEFGLLVRDRRGLVLGLFVGILGIKGMMGPLRSQVLIFFGNQILQVFLVRGILVVGDDHRPLDLMHVGQVATGTDVLRQVVTNHCLVVLFVVVGRSRRGCHESDGDTATGIFLGLQQALFFRRPRSTGIVKQLFVKRNVVSQQEESNHSSPTRHGSQLQVFERNRSRSTVAALVGSSVGFLLWSRSRRSHDFGNPAHCSHGYKRSDLVAEKESHNTLAAWREEFQLVEFAFYEQCKTMSQLNVSRRRTKWMCNLFE